MRRPASSLPAALLALAILAGPAAAEEPVVQGPYLVLDARTGEVFEHHDARRPWFPASTTKIMTAFVVFRAVKAGELALDSPVVVSARAFKEPPSKMGFKAGTVLTLDNALKMLMVKSANDLAVAIAETVGGSVEGFATRMNAESRRLGMDQSHWVNPHGLPDARQVTSARDMALLARAVFAEFPEHRAYMALPGFRLGDAVTRNYNLLVERYPGATGMKTGFICASGFNLVASAKRGERELIAVVFGAFTGLDRAERAAELLDLGFSHPAPRTATSIDTVASGKGFTAAFDMRPVVCGGKKPQTPMETLDPVFRTLPDGSIVVANPDGTTTPTRLGAKIPMEPVAVFVGGAKGIAGSEVPVAPPLPRPRPANGPALATPAVSPDALPDASADLGLKSGEPVDLAPVPASAGADAAPAVPDEAAAVPKARPKS